MAGEIRSLVQFEQNGKRGLACLDAEGSARIVDGTSGTLDLARKALIEDATLAVLASERAADPLCRSAAG